MGGIGAGLGVMVGCGAVASDVPPLCPFSAPPLPCVCLACGVVHRLLVAIRRVTCLKCVIAEGPKG